MTYNALLMIQWVSVLLLLAEGIYIFHRWKSRNHSFLFLYIFSTLINNLGYLLEISAGSSEAALTATQFTYLGKVFIPLALFAVMVRFSRINVPRSFYYVMSVIHAFVLVLVLTCRYQTLYYTGWEWVEEGLFPHNSFGHGICYYLYMGIIALYLIGGISMIIIAIRRERNKKRRGVLHILLASCLVEGGGFGIFIAGISGCYDATALAYTIGAVLMLVALVRFDLLNSMELAKNYAIDNLSEGIIAVEDGEVVYSNGPIRKMFPGIIGGYDDKMMIVKELDTAIEENKLLFINEHVFQPEIRQLYHRNQQRGNLYVLDDVTESYNYSARLEEEVALKTEKLQIAQESVITGMATMVESRDNSTGGHIRRTSRCVSVLTKHLIETKQYPDVTKRFYKDVAKAAPMHDLGKIAVDDAILRKPGRYTAEEFAQMQSHSAEGARIVEEILKDTDDQQFRTIAMNVAHYHHEKWNGTGYPCHLKGEEIPFEARIMALADVFDALVSKRCYKDSFSYDQAFDIIRDSLGTHFDPELGQAFLKLKPELEQLYNELLGEQK